MKFAISSASRNDHESATVVVYCSLNWVEYRVFQKAKDVPSDFIPVGTVPWVTEVLGRPEVPDYYPEFLSAHLHRKIWRQDHWPHGHRVFVKPADRHKRFTGFVTNGHWKGKRKGPLWCSEVVEFVSEWRWYVSRGQVLDARWNFGVEAPVPALNIAWPADYSAAVDFGLMSDGRLALIESNSPFSCGWYGSMGEGATYVRWLAEGWEYLKGRNRQTT